MEICVCFLSLRNMPEPDEYLHAVPMTQRMRVFADQVVSYIDQRDRFPRDFSKFKKDGEMRNNNNKFFYTI